MSEQLIPIRLGDIFRINLPNGSYAFGCVLRDAAVGIYWGVYSEPTLPPEGLPNQYSFVTGIYADILPSGICPIVGHREFQSENDEWPPPQRLPAIQDGKGTIYYKGKCVPCEQNSWRGWPSSKYASWTTSSSASGGIIHRFSAKRSPDRAIAGGELSDRKGKGKNW